MDTISSFFLLLLFLLPIRVARKLVYPTHQTGPSHQGSSVNAHPPLQSQIILVYARQKCTHPVSTHCPPGNPASNHSITPSQSFFYLSFQSCPQEGRKRWLWCQTEPGEALPKTHPSLSKSANILAATTVHSHHALKIEIKVGITQVWLF